MNFHLSHKKHASPNNRSADAHIRFCIVVCVFILLATLPMHFFNLQGSGQPKFAAHKNQKDIFTCQFSAVAQNAQLIYTNGFPLPADATYSCFITISDATDKIIILEHSTHQVSVSGGDAHNRLALIMHLKKSSRKNLDNCSILLRISDSNNKHLCSISGTRMALTTQLHNIQFEYPQKEKK